MTRVDRRAAGVTLSRKGAKNQTQSRKSRSTGTKTSTPGRRPGADLEQQLEKYRHELAEALEQQTATGEVLRIISTSPTELQPVLDVVVKNAARFCGADDVTIFQCDRNELRATAHWGPLPQEIGLRMPRSRGSVGGRAVVDGKAVHVLDLQAETEEFPEGSTFAKRLGHRTTLSVPMLREGMAIGTIQLRRAEVRPFNDKQIALLKTFAAQAVIAIENTRLLKELRQRTGDLSEALEQQTATSEVLKVISSSPGELEPVFQTMLENATRICEANFGTLFRFEGDTYRVVASHNAPPPLAASYREGGLRRATPGSLVARTVRTKQVCRTADYAAESVPGNAARLGGARSFVCVPMLKDDALIGALSIYRQEVRPFTEKQIALVQNFAAQAVIAIENTRLLNELRESLAQQTASSEVLEVISSSPGELEPVFTTMLQNALRICEAGIGNLFRYENGGFRQATSVNAPTAFNEFLRRGPVQPTPGTGLARVVQTKQTAHINDVRELEAYANRDPFVVAGVEAGIRTLLVVPMLKENELVGVIGIYRLEVRPFTQKQIELVTNFARQAVIAIENTRLLSELRESLQQQTATADVLKVISRSTFDLQTVLDTLSESAVRLCEADHAWLARRDGGVYRVAASFGHAKEEHAAIIEFFLQHPFSPGRGTVIGRTALEGRPVHVVDYFADPELEWRVDSQWREAQRIGKYRTALGVPLLREGVPIGVLAMTRSSVRPFSDKQIELATTFADQAVIAIENVRLFDEVQARTRELSEALDQQTAMSEVLKVISSSPGDLKTVFDTILAEAVRICEASFGNLLLSEGDAFRVAALHGAPPAWEELRRRDPVIRFGPKSPLARFATARQLDPLPDMRLEEAYLQRDPTVVAFVEMTGARSVLAVPMLKENELIGAIAIYRQEVRPFTRKQI